MMRLVQQKGLSWLQQHMVNFADDNHLSWQGSNEQQPYKAVNEAAEVLELLTDLGFHINFAKSVVMLRIVGQKERAFRRNHIIQSQGGMFLRNTYRIPVVQKWDYLGAVVGYPAEARKLHAAMVRHLRYIALSPRHVTRESNQDLCCELGRLLPIQWLGDTWERKHRAWSLRWLHLGAQTLVTHPHIPHLSLLPLQLWGQAPMH